MIFVAKLFLLESKLKRSIDNSGIYYVHVCSYQKCKTKQLIACIFRNTALYLKLMLHNAIFLATCQCGNGVARQVAYILQPVTYRIST